MSLHGTSVQTDAKTLVRYRVSCPGRGGCSRANGQPAREAQYRDDHQRPVPLGLRGSDESQSHEPDAEPGLDGAKGGAVSFGVLQPTGLCPGTRQHLYRTIPGSARRLEKRDSSQPPGDHSREQFAIRGIQRELHR